ncbi:Perilipin-5 [Portunus trituberculatus]|uniref:Perilipin-5 n=1 Tax=Portunus trituberculatus TaxID=210409 RepID=A0A5B7JFR4_PORTR|nr:Perilipin-5 [Portunus trituberculatus]
MVQVNLLLSGQEQFMMASTEGNPEWPAFPARLMALPAVNDACGLASHLYQRSKEYRQVGVALAAAENSFKTAVTKAAPLAEPLLRYAGHLKPLDDWACRRLDDVERMVPVVTKPSSEVRQ